MIEKQRVPSIKSSAVGSTNTDSGSKRSHRTVKTSGAHFFGAEFLVIAAFVLLASCSKGEKQVEYVPKSNEQISNKPGSDGATPQPAFVKSNGLYVADDEVGERHYLRFTDKEVWIEASKEDANAVGGWIGGEQSRTPKRAQYTLDGTNLTIDNRFLSLTGELRDDALQASVLPPNAKIDDAVGRITRVYRFRVHGTLPLVTEQSRHLADCFAQYQEFLAFTSQPSNPAQAKPLFDALGKRAPEPLLTVGLF